MISLLSLKSLVLCLCLLLLHVSAENEKCPSSFDCGFLGSIQFPFTTTQQPHCGLLAISGCEGKDPFSPKTVKLSNSTSSISYGVLKVESRSIVITDDEQLQYLQNRSCKAFNKNFTLPPTSPLAYFTIKYNITISKCNHSLKVNLPQHFYKYSNCSDYNIYYGLPNSQIPEDLKVHRSIATCPTVQLAVQGDSTDDPFQFLTGYTVIEIRLSDACERCIQHGKGQCLLDSKGKFYCANAKGIKTSDTSAKVNKSSAWKLGLGIGLPCIIIIGLLIVWYYKPKCVSNFYTNPKPESGSVYFGASVFTYKDLEIATKNFDSSRELGEGGFGIVYYGKLQDGREVAVKRLYEQNCRRVEQYMNEIKILTRLRHRNLVPLYGCTSRNSRGLLLVYEYISNGTVASHLQHHGSTNSGSLSWPIRMKLAVETATALAYLHASGIIHRDVKTNNILLDNNFCVKVADFGVSRLFPNDVTHVSTAPQGTPGYVDPEYHRCYQLTDKSDVYSFGVVLIELISSMPAIDLNRHKDEINLADLAVKMIQKSEICELVDASLGFESNSDFKRQITLVAELAFRCLQRDKELRPSMDEVLEMLKRIESGKDEPWIPLSPPSPTHHDEVILLRKIKSIPSPNDVTDKWDSESTSPNISGQLPSRT